MYSQKDFLVKKEIEHFVEDDSTPISKTQSAFRVATYNILTSRSYDPAGKNYNPQQDYMKSWDFRKDLIIESIRKLDIDVIALQEVRLEQLVFICQNLPAYGVIGYSQHCGKSLVEINSKQLPTDEIREMLPILYRKDKFKALDSKVWFLSDTPDKVSIAPGASRPRILVAAALKLLKDDTTVIISNTHYDQLQNTESLKRSGHWETQYIEDYRKTFDAYDTLYLGDRNSFIDQECDGNQWYAQFKQESKSQDTRESAMHFGAATTFIGYEDDKFKSVLNPDSGSFEPKVFDLIFYKGRGCIVKSLNSPVAYEISTDQTGTSSTVKPQASLCSFFGKPKNLIKRQCASDHCCVMADIEHEEKRGCKNNLPMDHGTKLSSGSTHSWPNSSLKGETRPNSIKYF